MRKQDGDSRHVPLGIGFICSMEYWVCPWCCKTRGKVVSIETKLSYEKLRRLRWPCVSSDVQGTALAAV